MNNIYKVIWSKAKNCYVVASEIARSHTKSATGSEKIGGVTRRSLLASLMALSLLCGGLGVASAADGTVNVEESTTSTTKVYTTDGTESYVQSKLGDYYTKTGVDEKIEALAGDVTTNKDNIGKNKDNITALQKKTVNLSDDGKKLTDMTAVGGATISGTKVNAGELKVTGQISDGTVSTKLADINESMTQTETNKGDIADLKTKTGTQQAWIGKLKDKTTEISYAAGEGTKISGVTIKDGNIVGNGNSAITGLTNVETDNINGKSLAGTTVATATEVAAETLARKEADNKLEEKINEEKTAREGKDNELEGKINTLNENGVKYDTAVKDKITLAGADGTTITNLKDAALSDISTDAVTGRQLNQTNKNLAAEETARTAADEKINKKIGSIDDTRTQYVKDGQTISQNLTKLDEELQGTNDRTGGIARNTEKTQTTIEGKVTVDNSGNVGGVKDLKTDTIHANGEITSEGLDAGSGEITTKGKVSAGDISTGTLETTGNAKIGGDLTVNGKLNVDKISLKNDELKNGKKHDSATTITADEISNLAKVTEQGNTTESQFTHNEKGTFNYAKDEKSTGEWKRATSNVTADGVSNKMTDSDGNTHTYYQTATESKEQLVNGDKSKSNFEKKTAEGNTISITEKDAAGNPKSSLTNTQTVNGEKTSVTNNDSSSTIKQGADQIRNYVASTDGTKSSTEVKADGITNTSDGTITNDANHIENKANTMDTTVTGKATESYGGLETTVNGNETHTVTGNQENTIDGSQTTTVKGKVTENYKAGQETNVTGNQDIKVSGTQTTTATDINRNASSGMIDTIDNDYGTNTETKVAGKTTTDVSIKGTGEEGKYIRGANESRDYLIKGTLKNSETKTVEKTSTEITDGNGNTSATIQDVNNLAGSVTNGTETGVSGIHANDNSVSIDSIVTDGNKYSVINQKKGSIQSTVVDGTNSTVILQDKDNVTIASSKGMVAIGGKDIVNNAQDTITNTAGTKITDTAGDSTVTTEKAKGTTFTKTGSTAYSTEAGAPTDTNIAGNHITTGRVDANELGVSDKDGTKTADFSVKAGKGVKASAGNGNTTGSLDVKADGIYGYAADKDGNKTYTKVTATENNFQIQDKDGKIKNHQVNTKDSSENTITNGDKTNTVTSTADGTTFNNSKANTAFEGGTYTDTTIKGNTITTGKVTMDYAEVMKDLGVNRNANIGGKTTTGSLEVKGESKLTGNVTMENNATVGNDLTVKGITTTKTLKVTENAEINGNATIKGDVTAKSYKVGDKTYINADGINANNQKITNVADGSISEGSKDAVNGGQLYNVKNDLEGKVNKVGANAAAMANLHPMEFDPDSKWNIAAAIGNYGSETAAALGAFYRPNDDVMVNLSTAFGTGENMVGGGVSVRLGKGGNKLSREESNALKDQVNDLTARMDALLSVLNPNMSKDFPDVPENHWAYEAVSRLAGNDIVQGYPDGEFHGERTMTRYEMAEIIYNALSRGAEAEKELVEEFKPELQAMAASEKATAEG